MKKDVESLLLFLVPAIIVEKLSASALKNYLEALLSTDRNFSSGVLGQSPGLSIGEIVTMVGFADALISLLPAVVIAVWIWKLERRYNGRPVLWALGAVALKYWILILFIGCRLYEKNNRPNSGPT